MAPLDSGTPFPRTSLTDADGARVSAPEGEALYVIFKTTCPTCELTWPYLERLRQAAGPSGLRVIAVSQDDPKKAAAFNRRLGSRVETVYDADPWPVSDRLGVENVPTFFRVMPDGSIAETAVGFARDQMERFAERASTIGGRPYQKLFRASDPAPASQPG